MSLNDMKITLNKITKEITYNREKFDFYSDFSRTIFRLMFYSDKKEFLFICDVENANIRFLIDKEETSEFDVKILICNEHIFEFEIFKSSLEFFF